MRKSLYFAYWTSVGLVPLVQFKSVEPVVLVFMTVAEAVLAVGALMYLSYNRND